MANQKISEQVIRRLPRYYRYLHSLSDNDISRISSKELGKMMGLTASQIRQDLNCFGGFGQQGLGYYVADLKAEIAKILGLSKIYNLILIGAGNIGQALINYSDFLKEGFLIKAVFEVDNDLIGKEIGGVRISDSKFLSDYVAMNHVDIAILAVNKANTLTTAQKLKELGIKNIWNFTPTDIIDDDLLVENVSISDSLFMLTFRMKNAEF